MNRLLFSFSVALFCTIIAVGILLCWIVCGNVSQDVLCLYFCISFITSVFETILKHSGLEKYSRLEKYSCLESRQNLITRSILKFHKGLKNRQE